MFSVVWGMVPNRYSPGNSGLSVSLAQYLRAPSLHTHSCCWMLLGVPRDLSPVSLVRYEGVYTWPTLYLVWNQRLSVENRTETAHNSKQSKFSESLSHYHLNVFLQTFAALDYFTLPCLSYFTRQFSNSHFNIAENTSSGNKKTKHSIFTFRSYSINHHNATTTCNIFLSQTWTLLRRRQFFFSKP